MLASWGVELSNPSDNSRDSVLDSLAIQKPLTDMERFSGPTSNFWEHPRVDGNSLPAQSDPNWRL